MSALADISTLIGLEDIQRAAFLQLFDQLNDSQAEIEALRDQQDQDFAARTQRAYVPTLLETISPDNFHEGHIPSLIEAPIDQYPNCTVIANQAVPAANSDQLDQLESYRDTIFVDVMVKSSAEEEVNRRSTRAMEAANMALMRDPTLDGIISGFETAASVFLSDVFKRKEKTSYGAVWYWQGARLQYAIRKNANRPTPSLNHLSGLSSFEGLEIDQA